MDKQQWPTAHHIELSSVYVVYWTRGQFGGEWLHVYISLSPFAVHLKLQYCQSAIPQYKIKKLFCFKKMKSNTHIYTQTIHTE